MSENIFKDHKVTLTDEKAIMNITTATHVNPSVELHKKIDKILIERHMKDVLERMNNEGN